MREHISFLPEGRRACKFALKFACMVLAKERRGLISDLLGCEGRCLDDDEELRDSVHQVGPTGDTIITKGIHFLCVIEAL